MRHIFNNAKRYNPLFFLEVIKINNLLKNRNMEINDLTDLFDEMSAVKCTDK